MKILRFYIELIQSFEFINLLTMKKLIFSRFIFAIYHTPSVADMIVVIRNIS